MSLASISVVHIKTVDPRSEGASNIYNERLFTFVTLNKIRFLVKLNDEICFK